MSNGSRLVVVLLVDVGGERGEGIVCANGIGENGGRRGGIELRRGMELLLGGTSFR